MDGAVEVELADAAAPAGSLKARNPRPRVRGRDLLIRLLPLERQADDLASDGLRPVKPAGLSYRHP
jgi:hypothetical protein